jgi:hypothetical protein
MINDARLDFVQLPRPRQSVRQHSAMMNLLTSRSMRVRTLLVALAAAATMVGTGCDEKLSDLTGPTPNLEPTFSSIQRDIFQSTDAAGRAGCTGCHTSAGRVPAAGLSLDPAVAYSSLVNAPSGQKPLLMRVAPNDPDNSYLIHKLEGRSDIVGLRMPRTTGPFLTEGQLTVIRRWIALGAPNN